VALHLWDNGKEPTFAFAFWKQGEM